MKRIVIRLAALCLVLCLLAGCGAPAAQEQNTDGVFQLPVTLEGGSGKASLESPALLTVENGLCTAEIRWSSPNYDYMIVNGEKFLPVNTEGNSCFVIPVLAFDRPYAVVADTTAMSQPYEIDYSVCFYADSIAEAAA